MGQGQEDGKMGNGLGFGQLFEGLLFINSIQQPSLMTARNLRAFSQPKQVLRSKYLARRKEFILREGPLNYSSLNQNLHSILSQLSCSKQTIIGSYIHIPDKQIIPPHLPNYKHAFPYFQARKDNIATPTMDFKAHLGEPYRQRAYGIKIPSKNATTLHPNIVLVPLVCFHPVSKHRIGYGKGYYDQYIREFRASGRQGVFIGVGCEYVKQEGMFWEEKDEALDYVITETNIY